MLVREAVLEDAPAIARLNVASWRTAYAGILPASFLDAMDVAEDEQRWRRAIALAGAKQRPVLVVERERGRVLGFAVIGEDNAEPGHGLLFLLYVAPEAWGTPAGHELMAASEAWLAERWDYAVLWVLEANARARRFYDRAGWHADGAESWSTFDDVRLKALRYVRTFESAK